MIRRHYFYQADTQTENSKFVFGIISLRSWRPRPWDIILRAEADVVKATGCELRQVKIVSFNRV